MEIKNGLVQWNGRNDIPCSYIDMEDGSRYYIKQDLSNGNHIVTTSLLEVVDPMTKAQNIGLINNEGSVLIPCVNKSIKDSMGEILLVELASPVSESVIEANKLRMDPLSTNKLVSTSAQIKDKINNKMSSEGRYLYNDQFSDITICDINGNNLVNDEYYSFIAKDNDKLYMTKNVSDTDVIEFSIPEQKVIGAENAKEETIATDSMEAISDRENIYEELSSMFDMKSVPSTEVVSDTTQESVEPIEKEISQEQVESVETNVEVTQEEIQSEETDLGEEVVIPTEEDSQIEGISFDVENETNEEEVDSGEDVQLNDEEDYLHEAEFDRISKSMEEKNDDIVRETQDIEEYKLEDSEVVVDSIDTVEDSDSLEYVDSYETEVNDTTMQDATKAISDLVQKYTAKDNELNEALDREERLKTTNDIYKNKIKAQEEKISLITAKNHDLMDSNAQYEAKIESLTMALDLQKRKSEEQRRTISEQNREIVKLNSQLAGKEELARALESARELIESSDSYDEGNSYYKVA